MMPHGKIDGERSPAKAKCAVVKNCGEAGERQVAGGSHGRGERARTCRTGGLARCRHVVRSDGGRMPAISNRAGVKDCGEAGAGHVAVTPEAGGTGCRSGAAGGDVATWWR